MINFKELITNRTTALYRQYFTDIKDEDWSFEQPLIGVSAGDDDLYNFLKKDIGEFIWTPIEAFSKVFAQKTTDTLSVISFIFPQTTKTKTAQKNEITYPSYEWIYHRLNGQKFINDLLQFLVNEMTSMGYNAMVPSLNENCKSQTSEKYGYAQNWSERHTAYVSGLGTFSLNDGLITEAGIAHRCGSIIIEADIPPTQRKYNSHTEYCLYYKNGSCKACIKRCPANAISEKGHDKLLCRDYKSDINKPYSLKEYGIKSTGCGLCQVGVPCESGIPVK